MSGNKNYMIKRKRIIVLSFEGKNNQTENNYFSHFCAFNSDYIVKSFSSGATDPKNMIKNTKMKRKKYDYKPSEDLTFIFMDIDNDKEKLALIKDLEKKQTKDTCIIISNPCFELRYLNHFVKTTRLLTSTQLFTTLKKYIKNYKKNIDVYDELRDNRKEAILNSEFQRKCQKQNISTNVDILFSKNLLKDK